MTETTAPPIEAHSTPLPDQLWAAVRQIAAPAMAFVIGRGWIADDLALLLAIGGGIIWPIVAGQLKTRRRAVELTTVVADPRTPDEVGRLR